MSGENRDEQLIALEAAVKKAESKLKSAEISVKDIEDKLKTGEENFQKKLKEKAIGYKEQTGADFVREVDSTGRTTYKFSREANPKEQKQSRRLFIRRQFDSENGTYSLKAEYITEPEDMAKNITSTRDFNKPKSRKRFIATKIMGHYGKIELSTEVSNPFLNVVGKPIIVPVQAAVKLMDKVNNMTVGVAQSSVGKGMTTAGKVISSPIVIPAKIIKEISDNGGIIHSVVDLGDRIKVEGFTAPKPVGAIGNVSKGIALGAETAFVQSVKGMKNFSVEIAKDKIYEEINKNISDNEATKAAFVIGLKTAEMYRILHEHSKYRRAVRRDRAGNDVTDTDVSQYLAEKSEKKFSNRQERMQEKKSLAQLQAENARKEYEAAKKRLEFYKSKNAVLPENPPAKILETSGENASLSKIDKKIEKTKRKLKYVRKHTYKLKIERVAYTDRHGKAKFKIQPSIKHEYVTVEKPATAWNTAKRLDGLAVGTATQSLRRKAMRDGGDNSGVEAGNFAITAVQQGNVLAKKLYEKQRQQLEKGLEKKLDVLENKRNLPTESVTHKPKPKGKAKRVQSGSKQAKAVQKRAIKKRIQKNVYKGFTQKAKQAAKELAKAAAKAVGSNPYSILVIIIPVIAVVIIMGGFLVLGVPIAEKTVLEQVISPCSTNDLGLCDRYYTELGKNLIDKQQNIESHYPDYDKYVCLTDIDRISHSPEKLLPYLAVKTLSENGSDNWTYEEAMPHIEDVFNTQYEFYTNEIHETRKNVTTTVYSSEDTFYSSLGDSTYSHERPSEDIPNPLESWGYAGYANTYTHVEITVFDGYIENILDSAGIYTDKDGNTTEYDEAQTMTFYNYWSINLVYDWFDDGYYMEYWLYKEERQEYSEFDYVTLEYAIKENNIEVDENYWSDTDENWQDNNFDKLIYNLVSDFSDSEKEGFQNYFTFSMGHQELKLPFKSPEITKYPGYNNDVGGDMSLDYSIELRTYYGQEIICGMDGEITPIDDKSFSVYNSKYGTLYYDYVVVPEISNAKKGDIVSSSSGDTLRITFIDNDGNYINPLFIFT